MNPEGTYTFDAVKNLANGGIRRCQLSLTLDQTGTVLRASVSKLGPEEQVPHGPDPAEGKV